MAIKRAQRPVHTASPARHHLRARKRQKVGGGRSRSMSGNLDSDGEQDASADETASDYEDADSEDGKRVTRRRRISAPSAGLAANRSSSARRTSLPQRAHTIGRSKSTTLRRRASRRRTGDDAASGEITQQPRGASRGNSRTSHPLSPLPVNHTVPRTTANKGKGKERAVDDDVGVPAQSASTRRGREDSAGLQARSGRSTRRNSGASTAPSSSQSQGPSSQPALRRSRRRSSQSQIDVDGNSDEDEPRAGPSNAPARRRRHTRSESITDLEPIADAEETSANEAMKDADDDLEAKLYTWTPNELHGLRATELTDLVRRLYADSADGPHPRTKDQMVQAILAARPPASASEESEQDDGQATPYPQTSQENSSGYSTTDSQGDEDAYPAAERSKASITPRRRPPKRRSAARRRAPTPPQSGHADDGDGDEEEDEAATEMEDAQEDTPRAAQAGSSTAMARRSSVSEMPPPPVPRRVVANGDSQGNGSAKPTALALFGRHFGESGRSHLVGATPVAHRTRGHVRPQQSPSPPRGAAAQRRPSAPYLASAVEAEAVSGSEGYNSGEESVEPTKRRDLRTGSARRGADASMQRARRQSQRTAQDKNGPPSDADEESGGELHEPRANGTVEAKSHQRQAGRTARTAKVVRLSRSKSHRAQGDDVEMQDGDASDESDEYEPDPEEDQPEDEVDLAATTGPMLMRYRKDDLVRLCEERDIEHGGRKKAQLVDALLQWRDMDVEASSPVSAASSDSTVSNISTGTARQETKTHALRAADRASNGASGSKRPLLMRSHHSASPEKPQEPENDKAHEHQEDVNALDLESLQLQDKEIQPEKLTKLERVGSGGFKDVYKGIYNRRTIAICEIRGHLTDMDIKELGLLRDLRHPNIVQFVGISLPKQPSHIPVMIITELCANGDLFDYIRKIDPPPFLAMLDIMLGTARGIEYLHLHKPAIIHRDIKSSNVLISAQGVAKIADFGLARIKNSTQSVIRSLVGTVNWQAPELWHPHPRYNEKVDVYSAALVFWEVLQWHQPVKRYPFEGQNEHAIYHDVGVKNLRPHPGPLRRQWGGEIVDLMEAMWVQDPSQRPAMTQVVVELELLRKEHLPKKPTSKERR